MNRGTSSLGRVGLGRVGPAVLAPLGAVCAVAVGATVVAALVGMVQAVRVAGDAGAVDPEAMLNDPLVMAASVAGGEVGILVLVVAMAVCSPTPWRQRLGLVRPALAWWAWAPMLAGNLFVWLAAVWLFGVIFTDPGEHLEGLTRTVTEQGVAGRVLLLVGAAVLPGIGEELVCRGFLLRRVLREWGGVGLDGLGQDGLGKDEAGQAGAGRSVLGAVLAVAVTSVLFVAMHLDPRHMVLLVPMSVYWSVVAWRAGSVVPTMVLHGLNNAWALVLAWVLPAGAGAPAWLVWTVLGVGAPGLVVTVVVLFWRPAPAHAGA